MLRTAALPARRRTRTRYLVAQGELDLALSIVYRVSDPAARAVILKLIGDRCATLAELEPLAFGRRHARFARAYRDDADIARLLAGVEAARAVGGPRLARGPDAFEAVARALLDALAQPDIDDLRRAAICRELCRVSAPFFRTGRPPALLVQHHSWYHHAGARTLATDLQGPPSPPTTNASPTDLLGTVHHLVMPERPSSALPVAATRRFTPRTCVALAVPVTAILTAVLLRHRARTTPASCRTTQSRHGPRPAATSETRSRPPGPT